MVRFTPSLYGGIGLTLDTRWLGKTLRLHLGPCSELNHIVHVPQPPRAVHSRGQPLRWACLSPVVDGWITRQPRGLYLAVAVAGAGGGGGAVTLAVAGGAAVSG